LNNSEAAELRVEILDSLLERADKSFVLTPRCQYTESFIHSCEMYGLSCSLINACLGQVDFDAIQDLFISGIFSMDDIRYAADLEALYVKNSMKRLSSISERTSYTTLSNHTMARILT